MDFPELYTETPTGCFSWTDYERLHGKHDDVEFQRQSLIPNLPDGILLLCRPSHERPPHPASASAL